MRELYCSLIFCSFKGAINPNVSTYLYYYQRYVGFGSLEIGMLTVITASSLMFGTMIYSLFLTKKEPRNLIAIGLLLTSLNYGLQWMFVTKRTFGLSPFTFLAITSFFSESFINSFLEMTCRILFAKLIPPNIEVSLYAL